MHGNSLIISSDHEVTTTYQGPRVATDEAMRAQIEKQDRMIVDWTNERAACTYYCCKMNPRMHHDDEQRVRNRLHETFELHALPREPPAGTSLEARTRSQYV